MKKSVKSIISILIVLVIYIIINSILSVSYAADYITQINGKQPLYWYLYGNGSLDEENNNKEKVYCYATKGQIKDNLMIDDGNHVWIKGIDSIFTYILNTPVESIKSNNDKENMQEAYNAVEHFTTWMNDSAFLKKQLLESFTKYTGYAGTKFGVSKYLNDKYMKTINKLCASIDLRDSKGLFTLDYKGLFALKYSDILKYIDRYGNDLFPGGITSEQKMYIKKVWGFKAGKYDQDKNSPLLGEIHADKSDSFEEKMKYNTNQIIIYQAVWGNDYNISNEEQKKALQTEWAFVKYEGSHTDYYKNNYKNGKVPYTFDSNNNIIYSYYSEADYEKANNNGWIEDLESSTSGYNNIFKELVQNDRLPNDTENLLENVDEAARNKNKYSYYLPDRDKSENGDTKPTDIDTIVDSANSFIDNTGSEVIEEDNIKQLSDTIYNILLIVGIIVAVLVGAIIGIKFMIGSIEEKANIKELLIPYIVGCVIVFGAFGIWKIAVIVLGNI